MTAADTLTRSAPTTAELLRAAGDGDAAAWERLVRLYRPVVAATIRSYRLQDADARDAEQHTWLRLVEHHRTLREPEALGGWLVTTAGRECLRILRNARRVALIDQTEPLPDLDSDTEQRVVDSETARQVRQLLPLLPTRARALLIALFGDDPPAYAELARRTGIPVGSIGPTRARALQRLRLLIDEPRSAMPRQTLSRARPVKHRAGLHATVHPDLRKDPAHVNPDSLLADEEATGDLAVGAA